MLIRTRNWTNARRHSRHRQTLRKPWQMTWHLVRFYGTASLLFAAAMKWRMSFRLPIFYTWYRDWDTSFSYIQLTEQNICAVGDVRLKLDTNFTAIFGYKCLGCAHILKSTSIFKEMWSSRRNEHQHVKMAVFWGRRHQIPSPHQTEATSIYLQSNKPVLTWKLETGFGWPLPPAKPDHLVWSQFFRLHNSNSRHKSLWRSTTVDALFSSVEGAGKIKTCSLWTTLVFQSWSSSHVM